MDDDVEETEGVVVICFKKRDHNKMQLTWLDLQFEFANGPTSLIALADLTRSIEFLGQQNYENTI